MRASLKFLCGFDSIKLIKYGLSLFFIGFPLVTRKIQLYNRQSNTYGEMKMQQKSRLKAGSDAEGKVEVCRVWVILST